MSGYSPRAHPRDCVQALSAGYAGVEDTALACEQCSQIVQASDLPRIARCAWSSGGERAPYGLHGGVWLERLILFGSYITAKPDPNDVDIILVMRDDFDVQACDEESQKLFDHPRAAETFGASVFWIRPALLVLETLEEFIAHWQITRDQTRRGIVEVRA